MSHRPQGPLAERTGTTLLLSLRDLHGDTIGTVAANQTTPTSRASYSPWGKATWSGASPLLGFQSQVTDPATGAVFTPARSYLPALARFSSPDPLWGDPAEPLSLNRYLYARDDPITLWDPTGLFTQATQGGDACGRACQARLEEPDDDPYGGERPQEPAGGPAGAAQGLGGIAFPTPFPERRFDWVQVRHASAWSKYVLGQDFLHAFAAAINGPECDEGIGCAPVNPGALGVSVAARLGYRSPQWRTHEGWTLDLAITLDLRRLNPDSGYQVQAFSALVLDDHGRPVEEFARSVRTLETAEFWVVFARLEYASDGPQPREVRAYAAAFPPEMNRAPIQTLPAASVVFDRTPIVLGPYRP